jgi:hypothetical protein
MAASGAGCSDALGPDLPDVTIALSPSGLKILLLLLQFVVGCCIRESLMSGSVAWVEFISVIGLHFAGRVELRSRHYGRQITNQREDAWAPFGHRAE